MFLRLRILQGIPSSWVEPGRALPFLESGLLQEDNGSLVPTERGMLLLKAGGGSLSIPTAAREVFDVTGAGDTVVAVMALALAAGASLEESAIMANHAAGVVVGKVGTAALTREELSRAVALARGASGPG